MIGPNMWSVRGLIAACVLIIMTPFSVAAQSGARVFAVADVVKLLQVGLDEDVVVARIKKEGKALDLSADDFIELKKAGATSLVLKTLMNPGASVEKNAEMKSNGGPTPTSVSPPSTQGQILEVGVYFKKAESWAEVLPEVVNWKTGGTLKSLATGGVVKKDVNGNLTGPASRNSVKSPLEFLIVASEGVSITEYQLIRLRLNKDYREFRTITGGILNVQSGAMRDMVPFEGKKVSPRTFSITLPANLGAGEYGFLSPGGGGSAGIMSAQMGKMYTFHFIE